MTSRSVSLSPCPPEYWGNSFQSHDRWETCGGAAGITALLPSTQEERRIQTSMDFGTNTLVVDGDTHVRHSPSYQPVPPATFETPYILIELRSGFHLYL